MQTTLCLTPKYGYYTAEHDIKRPNAAEHMPEAKLLKLKECELILRNTEPRK